MGGTAVPDVEKRERNSKMLRGQKQVSVSSLGLCPPVRKEDGQVVATAVQRRLDQSLF